MYDLTFFTDAGEVNISGESRGSYVSGQSFVLSVLRDLIDLSKDGSDPHRATWFYFGHDWSRDADELYLFFVIHHGKLSARDFHAWTVSLEAPEIEDDDEPTGIRAYESRCTGDVRYRGDLRGDANWSAYGAPAR